MGKEYFHTQEKRSRKLASPIICSKDNAWLGEGYYFWFHEDDAIFWGNKFKYRTGRYEIYKCEIDLENVLNTVFNEEHYYFWVEQIERAAKMFIKRTNMKPTLKEINDYLKEKGVWNDVDGIIFQDISENPVHFMVKEFQYKKRIQIAVYDLQIISKFVYHFDNICV